MTELTTYQNQTNEVNAFIASNLKSICDAQPCKENTRTKYFKDMIEFNAWLTGKEFSIDTVMKYRNEYLTKRTDIGTGTKNSKLAALRTLVKELYFRSVIPIDITGKLKNFNTETGHKKDGLDMNEVQKVKAYIGSITDAKKRTRLNTMFHLLTLQGLRQFEVCNIVVEDFNQNDRKIKITGKGKDEKEAIDLHPDTVEVLKEYLRITGKKSGYLFTSEKGTTKGERLTERGFRKIFDTVFDELSIDRSTHGFRHFFVSTMLEATGGNIGIVKQFSRHKSTAALVMYDDRKRKKEHNELFYTAFNQI